MMYKINNNKKTFFKEFINFFIKMLSFFIKIKDFHFIFFIKEILVY